MDHSDDLPERKSKANINSFKHQDLKSPHSKDTSCGIFGFHPKSLDKFGNILTFSIISGIVGVLASTQTYFASQIPYLEKQFGLNSAETGSIVAWSRIGTFVFNLFGSSIAQLVHIPRFLFWAMMIYSVAGICTIFPYFVIVAEGQINTLSKDISNSSLLSNQSKTNTFFFCEMKNLTNMSQSECSLKMAADDTTGYKDYTYKTMATVVFSFCLFIMGVMYAARFPFTTVFIDDNVKKSRTGFYLGFLYGIGIFGPAIAFAVGGATSKIYVTLEEVDFTFTDPRWIGAWWLGFIVFSVGTIVTALPMLCFPRRLKAEKGGEDAIPLNNSQDKIILTNKERIKERALSYWRVLTSPVFVSFIFLGCISGFPWVGYWSFISKYITTQFGTPLWKGNMILAVSNIVSLCAGCFGGGIITRRIKMTPRNCLMINSLFGLASVIVFLFGFLAGCDQPMIYGPETPDNLDFNISNTCLRDCSCEEKKFFPICGSNGVNYHNPCYAGCPSTSEKNTVFNNCTCIPDGIATAGLCPSDCPNLYPWAVINFFSFFIDALTWMPMITAWIRMVEDRDKSTAIGVQSIIVTLLSSMPAPIAYGKIIDTTCLIWESTCSGTGSCQFYNIVDFRIKIHAVTVGLKLVGWVGLTILLWKVWNVEKWEDLQHKNHSNSKEVQDKRMESLT